MPIPNAKQVLIPQEKVRDYLLSNRHPIGRFKATFFHSLGFRQDRWEQLEGALRRHAEGGSVAAETASEYGRKYVVKGELVGPGGSAASVVSVWIILRGQSDPRFVTAYPGE
jgi:hypothetical protein